MTKGTEDQTLTQAPAGAGERTLTKDVVGRGGDRTLTAGPAGATLTRTTGAGTGELTDKVDWQVGDVIDGKYEVRAELGRGGMGMVYKVHHREWDIDMAVKMPLAHLVADPGSKARFIREAQTWVDLGLHPNIVQCWYVRELGGVPRVFVDFVSGGSLKDWIKQGKVKPGEWGKIIDLVIQACDGLGYAHERGVVHRDVKPANMLMSEDGRLCVTDFGLVKVAGAAEIEGRAAGAGPAGAQHTLTGTGSELGTPEYGAPEQWGQAKHVDARADIYALGVVLFELCVGRRPFDDGTHSEPPSVLIGRHLSTLAPDARELNQEVPDTLAALIAKCLSKKTGERPESMAALRTALSHAYAEVTGGAYAREPPKAAELRADGLNNQAVSLWDLAKADEAYARWDESLALDPAHPAAVHNKAIVEWHEGRTTDDDVVSRLMNVKTLHPSVTAHLGRIHLERMVAEQAEQEMTEALTRPEVSMDPSAWDVLGAARMAQGKFAEAEEAFRKGLDLVPNHQVMLGKQAMARARTREDNGQILFPARRCAHVFDERTLGSSAIAITPDSRFVVAGLQYLSYEDQLALWDLHSGQKGRAFLGHTNLVKAVALTPDGTRLLSGDWDGALRTWDLSTGECLRTTEKAYAGEAVAVTPDGRFALTASKEHLRLWDLSTGCCCRTWDAEGVRSIAFPPQADRAVTTSSQHVIEVWDLLTGTCSQRVEGPNDPGRHLALIPNAPLAVTAGYNHPLCLWDLSTGKCVKEFKGHGARGIGAVAAMPNGRWVVTGGLDSTIRLWELQSGRCLCTLSAPQHPVEALAVAPDGKHVISGSRESPMRLWKLEPPPLERERGLSFVTSRIRGHSQQLDVESSFQEILGRAHKALEAGDAHAACERLAEARAVVGYERDPRALAFNACLAKHIPRSSLRAVWPLRTLGDSSAAVHLIALTSDGRFAITGNTRKHIKCWDLTSNACVNTSEPYDAFLTGLAVSPDNSLAAVGTADGTIHLREIATGKCLRTLKGHSGWVGRLRFTSDGSRLISPGRDNSLRVWDLSSGETLRVLTGHEAATSAKMQSLSLSIGAPLLKDASGVTDAALSPDGRHLVSAGADKTLRVWNLSTGKTIRILKGHRQSVTAVAVTPEGRFAVSASEDRTLRLWDLSNGDCLLTFAQSVSETHALTLTSEGRFAFSACADHAIRLWDLSDGQCLKELEGAAWGMMAMTEDARVLLSGTKDQSLALWELDWCYDANAKVKSLVEEYGVDPEASL